MGFAFTEDFQLMMSDWINDVLFHLRYLSAISWAWNWRQFLLCWYPISSIYCFHKQLWRKAASASWVVFSILVACLCFSQVTAYISEHQWWVSFLVILAHWLLVMKTNGESYNLRCHWSRLRSFYGYIEFFRFQN